MKNDMLLLMIMQSTFSSVMFICLRYLIWGYISWSRDQHTTPHYTSDV